MQRKKSWSLLALLLAACAIPDVDIVDSLDTGDDGSQGGTANQAGTKNTGKAGSTTETTDGGDDNGGAGEGAAPPLGGTTTGGKPTNPGGSGGARPSGGTGTGGTGTGGSGPAPLGAVAKFCNGIPIALELIITSTAGTFRIVAEGETCTPIVYDDCTPIPTGALTLDVKTSTGTDAWTGAMATVQRGDAWVFAYYFDNSLNDFNFVGTANFTAGFDAIDCSVLDYDDVLTTAPTAPGGGS